MEQNKTHVCPWWLGYILLIPFRRIKHNPDKLLASYIKPGMNVMDYGSAMGYFSIPMAQMAGENGKVYCVDIQEIMLSKLRERANDAGVGHIIKTRLVNTSFDPNELENKIDFTLVFYVVHEVPDQKQLFRDLYKMSKEGAKILFVEPKGHVSAIDFERSLQFAREAGFTISEEKPMEKGQGAVLIKRLSGNNAGQ